MWPNVFEGKALKLEGFCFELKRDFRPRLCVVIVTSCLVHVTQWRIIHLCSGFEQNGNIARSKQRK